MSPLHTRSDSRGAGQRGFTLVELLVVVIVLAILAGVAAIPATADGGAAALDLAQIQLQDAFVTAQTLAYSLGVPHGVVFDPATERFAVVAQDGQPASDPLTHADYTVDFTRSEQPRGVTIGSASFGATGVAGIFDGQGVPVAGGSLTISKGNATRTLVLDAATGKLTGP
jgi:prepilin-type N-terminal cleavage/methylation domain-containing protein